jgi:replicative DNA helicase
MAKKQPTPSPNTNFSDFYQEGMLVTALIYLPDCIGEVMKMIPKEEVFQYESTRRIYRAICELYEAGDEINKLAVQFHMIRTGQKPDLDKSGLTLEFEAMTPSDVDSIFALADALTSMYKRQVAYKLTLRLNALLTESVSDQELADDVLRVHEALTLTGNKTAEKTSRQAAEGAWQKMEKARMLYESKGMSGIPTGSNKLDRELGGWQNDEVILLAGRPAMGKCLGKGTKVIMFDGRKRGVEDIVQGDQLMGPDSKPRTVLSLARGVDQMYMVHQKKGISYRVNSSHILSLKRSRNEYRHKQGDILNIPIEDYIKSSKKFKSNYKGYRSGVEFPEKELTVDPYYMGLWLGDGTSSATATITNPDKEIIEWLEGYAKKLGLIFKPLICKDRCPGWTITTENRSSLKHLSLTAKMKAYGVHNNKHIPDDFIYNSRENRLKLLAGLLDTDGGYSIEQGKFTFSQKCEKLTMQVKYLCDSLGLMARVAKVKATIKSIGYECDAYQIGISGDLDSIPTRVARKQARPRLMNKDWRVSGLTIEPDGIDEYFGFELDGDGLFLLEDFTVTHNTSVALDFMLFAAKQGHPVGFFSMEMDSEDLNFRLASIETGIPYVKMIKGWTTIDERKKISEALSSIGSLPIFYYDDVSVQNVGRMTMVAKEWCRTRGIKLIFIDYIQYLQVNDKFGNSTEQISAVSRGIKTLQRMLKIPIIALAQLGRQVDSRPDPRPKKEDLKESGQLEQDASTIIGLFYPDEYERKGNVQYDENKGPQQKFDPGAYCLYLLKRRSGGYARIDRYADLPTSRFSDTDVFSQPAPSPIPPAQVIIQERKFPDVKHNFEEDPQQALPF